MLDCSQELFLVFVLMNSKGLSVCYHGFKGAYVYIYIEM